MAIPVTTTRLAPAAFWLQDGYRSLIALALDPNIEFFEKTVTPPGIDGGDAVDTFTMHNDNWRTFGPRCLLTLTEAQCTAAYDPLVYPSIVAITNAPGSITNRFSDLSTLDWFGYVRTFTPAEMVEGTQPTCTVVFQPTNYDPINCVEEGPVLTSYGTCYYPCTPSSGSELHTS